jgi:hypothetical protein
MKKDELPLIEHYYEKRETSSQVTDLSISNEKFEHPELKGLTSCMSLSVSVSQMEWIYSCYFLK